MKRACKCISLIAMAASSVAAPASFAGNYTLLMPNNVGFETTTQAACGAGGAAAGYVKGSATFPSAYGHAGYWADLNEPPIDLQPNWLDSTGGPLFDNSGVSGMDVATNTQVGYGVEAASNNVRPLLWHGTQKSAVDLTPPGFTYGQCFATSGNVQVGYAVNLNGDGWYHAGIWSGTAASFQDINPAGYPGSIARATDGQRKVGAADDFSLIRHAVLWSSTNALTVLPRPSSGGILETDARSIYGSFAGGEGWGTDASTTHALLWNLAQGTVTDLHPAGWYSSMVTAVGPGFQVGWGVPAPGEGERALLWRGSAVSVLDLGADVGLPGGGYNQAEAIDPVTGRIYGYLKDRAVVWVPVPEPTSTLSLLWCTIVLASRQTRIRPNC